MAFGRGRPTEQAAPVTRTLHVRLTEAEHAALMRLAAGRRITVSRLVRRAVREMVTGAPDPFDDGLAEMSRLSARLGALERSHHGTPISRDIDVRAEIEAVRQVVAALVQASRRRWAPVLETGTRPEPT